MNENKKTLNDIATEASILAEFCDFVYGAVCNLSEKDKEQLPSVMYTLTKQAQKVAQQLLNYDGGSSDTETTIPQSTQLRERIRELYDKTATLCGAIDAYCAGFENISQNRNHSCLVSVLNSQANELYELADDLDNFAGAF